MIKNYHRRNKKLWLYFLPLVVVLILVAGQWLLPPLNRPVVYLLRPVWWFGEQISQTTANLDGLIISKINLQSENRRLIEENNKLKSIILAKNQLEADNAYLRKIFGHEEKSQNKPLLAQVIFLPDFIPYNSLLVDTGRSNSNKVLRVGDWAVSGNVIIGKVAEVGETSSKIRLLSAEKSIPVAIGKQNIPALAAGDGAGNFSVILPKNAAVTIGDRVIASLIGNRLVGTVRNIERLDAQPTETVLIKIPINLWQLKWLEIYEASS